MSKNNTQQPQDPQFRKVQITINNPKEHGYDHAMIKKELSKMKSCTYWIMGDEIGENGTYHTHIFIVFKSPVRFSTIKNRFEGAHIERAFGSNSDNHDYICKSGKWKDTEKSETSVPDTIEEWGECPSDPLGSEEKLKILYSYIKDGLSNYEILERCTDYLFDTDKIDRVRLILKQEEYKEVERAVKFIYRYGPTGTGKTSGVYSQYGYGSVFRTTDYKNPFDTYAGEDVIVFEEFSSSIRLQDLLNYTDKYPLKLPCRYNDKTACFTKVYILSNLPLEKQYPNIQEDTPQVWRAFLRRLNHIEYCFKYHKQYWRYSVPAENYTSDKDMQQSAAEAVRFALDADAPAKKALEGFGGIMLHPIDGDSLVNTTIPDGKQEL